MASLGASERVDVPWVTLMGSPSITARLPGVVAQRVHAAAGTCITDEHKARGRQRAGATQRGATTSVCASLCQSFVAEVSRGGVLKTQTIFGPQLFKAVNKVFKSTSWFPWYKSFSLTCKAQRKFHPSIPNFYLKRHLGYSSECWEREVHPSAAGHIRAIKGSDGVSPVSARQDQPHNESCARCWVRKHLRTSAVPCSVPGRKILCCRVMLRHRAAWQRDGRVPRGVLWQF
jgi:hypothetical protein